MGMENCAEKNGSELSTLQDAQHHCKIGKLWVDEPETDNKGRCCFLRKWSEILVVNCRLRN